MSDVKNNRGEKSNKNQKKSSNKSDSNQKPDDKKTSARRLLEFDVNDIPKNSKIPQPSVDVQKSMEIHNISAMINSDKEYISIVKDVVSFSKKNLECIRSDKQELRNELVSFCIRILGIQLFMLCFFIFLSAMFDTFNLSDEVLIAFMTSIFVETLGAIIVMVNFAFKSKEEVEIVNILNAVVKNYQKYKEQKKQEGDK